MLAAGVGIYMLPAFGWQSMFFAAGIPLVLLPVILYLLPESVGFQVRQGRHGAGPRHPEPRRARPRTERQGRLVLHDTRAAASP